MVELPDGTVWEPSSQAILTAERFNALVDPIVDNRYTANEAAMMLNVGKHGPWTAEERAKWLSVSGSSQQSRVPPLILTPISPAESHILEIAYRGRPMVGTLITWTSEDSLEVIELAIDEPGIVNREFLSLLGDTLGIMAKEKGLSKVKIKYLPQHFKMYELAGFAQSYEEGESSMVVRHVGGNPTNNLGIPKVVITEIGDNISAHIPGIRATAELSRLGQPEVITFGLEPNKWLWFNRLINQSGIPHMGTLLLDGVLNYCKEKDYSILNHVSAYGAISQRDLENWYISKGFTPVDKKKYGNALLKWSPK